MLAIPCGAYFNILKPLTKIWHILQKEMKGPYGWAQVNAHVQEIGILISNHTARVGDKGLVVIGGSIDLGMTSLFCSSFSIHLELRHELRAVVRK